MVKNHHLAKAIQDCSWQELARQLQYKADWNKRIYLKINNFFPSSQLCNTSGYQNTDMKNLSLRYLKCPVCHALHDRDVNASINILKEGLKQIS